MAGHDGCFCFQGLSAGFEVLVPFLGLEASKVIEWRQKQGSAKIISGKNLDGTPQLSAYIILGLNMTEEEYANANAYDESKKG